MGKTNKISEEDLAMLTAKGLIPLKEFHERVGCANSTAHGAYVNGLIKGQTWSGLIFIYEKEVDSKWAKALPKRRDAALHLQPQLINPDELHQFMSTIAKKVDMLEQQMTLAIEAIDVLDENHHKVMEAIDVNHQAQSGAWTKAISLISQVKGMLGDVKREQKVTDETNGDQAIPNTWRTPGA